MLTLEQAENYNTDDEDKYAEILKKTNSYKYLNSNKIKSSIGCKYNNIIKPLLVKKGIVKFKRGGIYLSSKNNVNKLFK